MASARKKNSKVKSSSTNKLSQTSLEKLIDELQSNPVNLKAGKLEEAEKTISDWIDEHGDSVDTSFLQCFIHLSLREFDDAEKAGLKFLELIENDSLSSKKRLSQVYNFLGSIKVGKKDLAGAEKYFEDSINSDKKNHLPYLNLANLYANTNEKDKVLKTINLGLKCCSEIQELRILANSLKARPTISACMIVKNEEELLPDCLESIRDWVDEIVIVDTGSTDKTVEIALSYGAKIFHQPWEGNFSKHRNYSIEKATSDWIFIIDADERFINEDINIIRQQINKSDYDIIAINVYNVSGKYEEKVTSLASVRLFKRELNLRYQGIVHNQLEIDPSIPVLRTRARIKHLGYGLTEEKMAAKADRTIKLLEKQIKERPDFAFAYFNYAQVLLGQDLSIHTDNPQKIIKAASKAVELTKTKKSNRSEQDIHLMSLEQLAMIYFIIGQNDKAEKYALKALKIKEDYLDPILLLGNVYLRNRDFLKAEEYYNRYLKAQKKYEKSVGVDELLMMHPKSFHHAYYGLGMVSEFKKDTDQAIKYFEDVLKTHPEFLDTASRLGKIYLSQAENEKADEYFRRQLEFDPKSHLAAVGLVCTCSIFNENTEAKNWAEKALELVPSDCPDLAEYSRVINVAGQKELAIKFLDKAATSSSFDQNTLQNLARQSFDLGQYDHSAHFYNLLIENEGPNPEWLNDLGGCYYKLENYSKAEIYYQKALEQEGFPAITFRNLGLTHMKLGKIQESVIVLEKYIELEPDRYEILTLLGDLYQNLNDYSRAINYYERYLRMYPTVTSVLFSLSNCYLVMGHSDSAILGFTRILQIDPNFKPAQDKLLELQQTVEKY
ncbi:MAG: tetratricopeptide repeat protein [bacterium]